MYHLTVLKVRSSKWVPWGKIKVFLVGLCSFWSLQGGFISLPFSSSRGCPPHSLALSPSSVFKGQSSSLHFRHSWPFLCLCRIRLTRNLLIRWDHPDISGYLHLKIFSLTVSARSLLPCKIAHSQILGMRMCTHLGGHYSPYHNNQIKQPNSYHLLDTTDQAGALRGFHHVVLKITLLGTYHYNRNLTNEEGMA